MSKLSVSFLSSRDVIDDVLGLDKTTADYIHVDVMDGKFTKFKFDPFKKLDYLMPHMHKRLDVHLMVKKPLKYILEYVTLNVEYITIHVEIEDNIKKYLDIIKEYGIKTGVSINPDTDISLLKKYLDDIDMILVMSVMPGKYGQEYIEGSTKRISEIKALLKENNKNNILVSVDGGINDGTISNVKNADIIVSGSYILSNSNYQDQIDVLRSKI